MCGVFGWLGGGVFIDRCFALLFERFLHFGLSQDRMLSIGGFWVGIGGSAMLKESFEDRLETMVTG